VTVPAATAAREGIVRRVSALPKFDENKTAGTLRRFYSGCARLADATLTLHSDLFQKAQPLEKAVLVPVDPALGNLPVFEAVDFNARPRDFLPGRWLP